GGYQAPDVVANIRFDQTWGSGQVMGAWHLLNPEYFNPTFGGDPGGRWTGHPDNESGWAVGAGLRLNLPMITQGDYFQSQVNYTQGALRYIWGGGTPTNLERLTSNNATFGIFSDCVFGSGNGNANSGTPTTKCELTTGWNVNAAYEHYWTPAWHQSFVGMFGEVKYNAQANNILCGLESNTATVTGLGQGGSQATLVNGAGSLPIANAGCNNNFKLWGV